jgi:ribose transport system permease protein
MTYAVGHSPKAAYMSGVNVRLTTVSVYAISGLLAALTGVLLTGYTKTSYLNIGDPYQLSSIAAVVVGGTSILGGFGSYIGTIAGSIIITTIQGLLPILSISEAGRQVVSGSIILVLLLIYGRATIRA